MLKNFIIVTAYNKQNYAFNEKDINIFFFFQIKKVNENVCLYYNSFIINRYIIDII